MRIVAGLCSFVVIAWGGLSFADDVPPPSPNGIAFPSGYQDWRVIGVSHRLDNETMRAILGNDVAIEAARAGQTKPWPDGAVLAKVVVKQRNDDNWPDAIVPADWVHVEIMVKDSERYASTLDWGFARWLGAAKTPYGEDAGFAQECVGCHEPLADRDYVFTTPIDFP